MAPVMSGDVFNMGASGLPNDIACRSPMRLPAASSEAETLAELKSIAGRNRVSKSFTDQAYHGTHTR